MWMCVKDVAVSAWWFLMAVAVSAIAGAGLSAVFIVCEELGTPKAQPVEFADDEQLRQQWNAAAAVEDAARPLVWDWTWAVGSSPPHPVYRGDTRAAHLEWTRVLLRMEQDGRDLPEAWWRVSLRGPNSGVTTYTRVLEGAVTMIETERVMETQADFDAYLAAKRLLRVWVR